MAWFKVDDKLHSAPKLLSIPRKYRLAALGLWTISGSWSADQLTDGKVPDYMVEEWGGTKVLVEWLVKAGLWQKLEDASQFKNWDEYQPVKADVEAGREKNREKLRKWRGRNAGDNPDVTRLHPDYEPASNTAPDPTRPDPTHSLSKESVPSLRKKPAVRLPASWVPNEAHTQYAKAEGIALDFQAERFRTHAEANDRRIVSWDAAFKNWLLKAERTTTTKPAASSPWNQEFHK